MHACVRQRGFECEGVYRLIPGERACSDVILATSSFMLFR